MTSCLRQSAPALHIDLGCDQVRDKRLGVQRGGNVKKTEATKAKNETPAKRHATIPDRELNELAILFDQILQLLLICQVIGILLEVEGDPSTSL